MLDFICMGSAELFGTGRERKKIKLEIYVFNEIRTNARYSTSFNIPWRKKYDDRGYASRKIQSCYKKESKRTSSQSFERVLILWMPYVNSAL